MFYLFHREVNWNEQGFITYPKSERVGTTVGIEHQHGTFPPQGETALQRTMLQDCGRCLPNADHLFCNTEEISGKDFSKFQRLARDS